ncbi:CHASE domain-containing protein, partial [bacterium]|nr:CHASE domain-containing protein [bacterium]
RMVRAGRRTEYFPVYYVEPLKGNEAAIGFDIASETRRKSTLEKACDMNVTIITGGITLVQEIEEQYGFLIFGPVYHKGALLETIKQRREQLVGYTLGVFRIGDMVERAWKEFPDMNLDIRIYDVSSP